jgi:DUF971 family protein
VGASIAAAPVVVRQPKVLGAGPRLRFSAEFKGMQTAPDASATTPTRIHADRDAGTLELEWQDGHLSTYTAHDLRWLCPCAFCRGEAGLPGWLETSPTLTSEQTRLVDVHLVGSYAIAPTWGDGHHTGYYPFRLLRDRCSCPECTSRRAARPADPRHGMEGSS